MMAGARMIGEADAAARAELCAHVPCASASASELNVACGSHIQILDDGFDSDVEIVSAQLFGVAVHGGRLAVDQLRMDFLNFKAPLAPCFLVA